LNKIWELPTEKVEEAIVAKLPAPTFTLPREKPLPKPKPQTKWQKYAQEKGITKTKKSKLTWDQTLRVSAMDDIRPAHVVNMSCCYVGRWRVFPVPT